MRLLMTFLMLAVTYTAVAQPLAFVEGVDYTLLPDAVKTDNPDKIEVAEVFSYGCVYCYRFETSVLHNWSLKKQAHVDFVEVPATFNPAYLQYARIYYTAKALNKIDDMHLPIFEAIHKERKRMTSEKQIQALFEQHGVDNATFKKYFNNFGIKNQVKKADARVRAYQVSGTPEIIVDGRYKVSANGGFDRMALVTEFLVNKIKAERGA